MNNANLLYAENRLDGSFPSLHLGCLTGVASAAADPETMMDFKRLTAGRPAIVAVAKIFAGTAACGILSGMLVLASAPPAWADDEFPFDRSLLLDTAPMRPVKRVPMVTVAADGRATVNLWCRSVEAFVQLAGRAIRIQTAPLPESLPRYMSDGQCSERRVQADNEMLMALAQVTQWSKRGDGVELKGPDGYSPGPMRFRLSSH